MMRTSFMAFLTFTLFTLGACSVMPTSDRSASPRASSDWNSPASNRDMIPVQGSGEMMTQPTAQQQNIMQRSATGKIAILLPLSGQNQKIGQALLQSAQLALFDMKQNGVELIPLDTKGTAQGAQIAAEQAAKSGASVILGPVFADAVAAAGRTAAQYNLNVIGFTTDWTKAGGNVMTLGILPFDQGARLAQFAAQTGKKRVLIMAPNSTYANAVTSAFEQAARSYGIQIVGKVRTDATMQAALQGMATKAASFDAILIPTGNPELAQIAAALNNAGLTPTTKLWMGTGVWDDPAVKNNAAMSGAVFASPSPELRKNFEQNYQALYGNVPPRLASLSYDAMALTITILAQQGTLTHQALLNPNGFAGIDGIFRLQSNGLAQRGLAIHRITSNGQSIIADQAPKSFLTSRGDFAAR